ncbi:hypothetical protein [Pseudoalteromonas phage GXT1010]|nr:hypothetical protein [Pseudoalteromonas phage GXT1010]
MSCYNVEIEKLDDSEEHWDYARGKVAQLKLAFKNKKAELAAKKRIEQSQPQESITDDSELRRRALALAAQNRAVTL